MNKIILLILAFAGGIFLAIQGGLNARLGVLLKNPLLASLVASFSSIIFALVYVLINAKSLPTTVQLKEVPVYLWFTGGLFSVMGISLYYYTIPKLGLSTMISAGLFGQLLFSAIAGNFGWFNLPIELINTNRVIGIMALSIGVLLINLK